MPDCSPEDRRNILADDVVDIVIEFFAYRLVNERLEAMKRKFIFFECPFCVVNLPVHDQRLPENKFYAISCMKRLFRGGDTSSPRSVCNGTCIPNEFNIIKLV